MMKIAYILLASICYACTNNEPPKIRVLDFFEEHPAECKMLYVTSGQGKDQEQARIAVEKNVVAAGGNAVVYHGGRMELDPKTKQIIGYVSQAIIFRCNSGSNIN